LGVFGNIVIVRGAEFRVWHFPRMTEKRGKISENKKELKIN